ncbi:hypothetical protein, partial [Bilophila wadsworthia]|uniref:hypothetical protein n=1 Tax=Bilophila wadsworthia TaxID=35833 RepID=UPI003AB3675B
IGGTIPQSSATRISQQQIINQHFEYNGTRLDISNCKNQIPIPMKTSIPPTPKTFGWWGGCSAGVPVGWERDRTEKGGCTYSQQIAVGPVSAFFLIMSWRLIY